MLRTGANLRYAAVALWRVHTPCSGRPKAFHQTILDHPVSPRGMERLAHRAFAGEGTSVAVVGRMQYNLVRDPQWLLVRIESYPCRHQTAVDQIGRASCRERVKI